MIKLIDILKEIEVRPAMVDMPKADDDFIMRGFKTDQEEIDPETGSVTSTVKYIPKFDQIKREIYKFRTTFLPFKQHPDPVIAKNAKDVNTLLTKTANMVLALENAIEIYKQELKNK